MLTFSSRDRAQLQIVYMFVQARLGKVYKQAVYNALICSYESGSTSYIFPESPWNTFRDHLNLL